MLHTRGFWFVLIAAFLPGLTPGHVGETIALGGEPKILILGIDGCRPDALQVASTPQIDGLIVEGAVSYIARNTMTHGSSGSNWSSMLTGVNVSKHGVTGNSYNSWTGFDGNNYDEYPPLFSYLDETDPSLYLASFSDWNPINIGMFLDEWCDELGTGSQAETAGLVANCLQTGDPDCIFVQLDEVDHAGHTYGFSPTSAGYVQAIEQTDTDIGTILDALYARPGYQDGSEDWLVFCSTDHGGLGTGHSLPSGGRDVYETFYIVNGPSVEAGADLGSPRIFDIAVTALHHMGVDTTEFDFDGHVVGIPGPVYPLPPTPNPDAEPALDYKLLINLSFNGNLRDSSGNDLHAFPHGFVEPLDSGKLDGCYGFSQDDSLHQYVTLPGGETLDLGEEGDFTVSIWVRNETGFPDESADGGSHGDPSIISNKDWQSGTNAGWAIAAGEDGRWQWNIGDGSNRVDYDGPAHQIDDGLWHLLTVTHDRDADAVFYYDGAEVARESIAAIGDIDSGLPTVVGSDGMFGRNWPNWFEGQMDDLGIWGRVLSADEVALLWNDGDAAAIAALMETYSLLPGDADRDGTVGSGDLDIIRAYWSEEVAEGYVELGDFTGDGLVNSADLDAVRANWAASATAAVPEPGGLGLTALLAAFVAGVWRSTRRQIGG